MLRIIDICKQYGTKKVLNNVSLDIPDGKICALLGLNGAGKSTLMKIICGLVFADSGSIENYEQSLNRSKRTVGFMIEDPCFYNELSGKQNLIALSFLYKNVSHTRIDEVLSLVGLEMQKNLSVKKYSIGMKKRLYFAYAILNNPKLIVLDEPFSGVDPVTVHLFQKLILELSRQGCSFLISGHTINEIQSISDSVAILEHGQLIYVDYDITGKNLTNIFLSLVDQSGDAQ